MTSSPEPPPTEPAPGFEPQPEAEQGSAVEHKAHAYAREQGVSRPLYAFARLLTLGSLRMWFRVRVSGVEHIPSEGPAILAPNHKNFLDPFFIGIATRRHVHYMAKVELFKGPLAWLFSRLGAFPVRRGEADAEALESARRILDVGGVLVIFPEGTRVEQPDVLGSPHHGAAGWRSRPALRSSPSRSAGPRTYGAARCLRSGGSSSHSSPRSRPRPSWGRRPPRI